MAVPIKLKEGDKFGKLTYIRDAERMLLPSGQKPRVAYCQCECGNFKEVLVAHLTRGKITSCGCASHEGRAIPMVGERFGMLTIIEELPNIERRGRTFRFVRVQCQCGNIKDLILNNVRYLKSCGCNTKQICKERNVTHGLSETRIYRIWQHMRNRCYNKKVPAYKYYGARGIKVCDEWRNSFESFYEWAMSNGYNDTLTIDRIWVNGNYEPSNCRWATYKVQANNKRSNTRISYKGETMTISELCDKYNLHYHRVHSRMMELGWNIEDAVEVEKIEMQESIRIMKDASRIRKMDLNRNATQTKLNH
jgi:hypothetical protein